MRDELTISNFSTTLSRALEMRFHPLNREARLTEVGNTLRAIIGENAWYNDLLDKRDIATLYAVIEGRKRNIPASVDPDSHNTQHWLGVLVKESGIKLGMRERDFDDQKLVNRGALARLLSAEAPLPTPQATNYDALANRYGGSDHRTSLIDPDLLPDENPLVIKKRQNPGPKPRAEKKAPVAAAEPSHKVFDKRWDALQAFAKEQEMGADGVTTFIAQGPKEAINLDPQTFQRRCETAVTTLRQVGADHSTGKTLLDSLAAAYSKHHEKRALGGIPHD